MASVAVIIPTRNMADTLWVALGSACRAGADEIVVIDDASEDHTPSVVGLWQAKYPQIKYVRHATKLPDHNAAQREVYASLKSDYVIGLAADDILYSNCIREIREAAENGDPAVVFTGVDVLRNGEYYIRTDVAPARGHLTPSAVSARFRSDANITESGIGSALRRDMAMWLWGLGWESLGPCMDSVGYGTVACLKGAAYVHKRCAALAFRERSYGRNPDWGEDFYLEVARKSIDFMISAGLDRDTTEAICKKRCQVASGGFIKGMAALDEYFLSTLEEDILRGPRRVAVDVGANKGQWSQWLSEHFDHVVSVEPDARAIERLQLSMPGNVHILNAACSDSSGVVDLYVREMPDQTSILPIHPIGAGSQADAPVVGKVSVDAVTMDGILETVQSLFGIDQIDFVKMDIEGAEHIAMAGATPGLFRETRWLVEVHDNRIEVGEAIRRLGHEDIRVVRHPHPLAHPEHMWVFFNGQKT